MKIFLFLPLLALAGCANPQAASDQEFNYGINKQIVAQWKRYSCVSCMTRHPRSLEGYSKENTARVSVSRPLLPSSSPRPSQTPQDSLQVKQEIYDLSQRIATLEEALRTNATTTNANEGLIVQQIREMKGRMAELQTAAPMVLGTPKPSQETPSGIHIGN